MQFKDKLLARNTAETGKRYEWYALQRYGSSSWKKFELPKIIWGNLATEASFAYDEQGYYINNPACFIPTNEKWLLALLNSSTVTFFLKNKAIERQGGFFEQKPVYVRQIPIPNVTHDLRTALTDKVEQLLTLNVEIQELQAQSLEVLRAEYALPKITQKLERFLSLGWDELIEELDKQKIRMNLTQKDTLNVWFRSKQNEAKKLSENVERLIKEIDASVYKLYDLNDAEIKLIELVD